MFDVRCSSFASSALQPLNSSTFQHLNFFLHSLPSAGKYRVSSQRSGSRLKKLVKLSQRKEALLAEIQNIDRDMIRLEQEFRDTRRKKNFKGKLTVSSEPKKRRK